MTRKAFIASLAGLLGAAGLGFAAVSGATPRPTADGGCCCGDNCTCANCGCSQGCCCCESCPPGCCSGEEKQGA